MTVTSEGTAGSGRPGRRGRRLLLWAIGLVACLVAAAALLGPFIGGAIVRSSLQEAGNQAINGKVEVGGVSLSWFGAQGVGPVTVVDAKGERVASVRIGVQRGLLSLAAAAVGLSPMDLGTVSLTGEATVTRFADGRTTLDDLVRTSAPASGGSGQPGAGGSARAKLPLGLAATFNLDLTSFRLLDQATGREVRVNDIKGNAAYAGGVVSASLNAEAVSLAAAGAGETPKAVPAGILRAEATVRDLVDGAGNLTPDRAVATINVDLTDVAMDIAGVLSGVGASLAQGVGETARITAHAEGGLEHGRATFAWTSRGVRAAVAVRSEKGIISLASPATLNASGAAVSAATSLLGATATDGAALRVESYPGVDLTIGSLRVPLPSGRVDLRGVALDAGLKTTTAALAWQETPGAPPRLVSIGPVEASIRSETLAGGISTKVNTGMSIDNAAAARIEADATVRELLEAGGAWRSGVPLVEGQARVMDVATAVWQPLVQPLGIDLVAGVGPRASFVLTAKPGAEGKSTEITAEVSSDGLQGNLQSRVDGTVASISGEATLRSPRALVGSKLESAGLDVSPGGLVTVAARGVTLDLQRPVESVTGEIEAAVGELSLLPHGVRADPLQINRIVLAAKRPAGEPPRLRVDGTGSHDGQAVAFQGRFEFPRLKGTGPWESDALVPEGALRFTALPTTLASLWLGEETGLDRLIADSIGQSMTAELTASPAPDRASRVSLSAKSSLVESSIVSLVSERQVQLQTASLKATLTPEVAARWIDRFAPGSTSLPSLAGPAETVVRLAPVSVPLRSGAPDWSGAGVAELQIDLRGDIRPPGMQPSMQATVRDTAMNVQFPLASLGDSAPRQAALKFQGTLAGPSKESFASVLGSASVPMAGTQPSGAAQGEVTMDVSNAAGVDAVLGKPGFMTGAVGEKANLKLQVRAEVKEGQAPWAGATAQLAIASPRLTTSQPLKLTGDERRLAIQSPMVARWTPDPTWLNEYALAAQRAGEPIEPDSLRVTETPELTVRVLKLAVPMGNVPRLALGVFELDVQVEAPKVAVAVGNGGKKAATLQKLAFRTIGGHEPGVLGFSLRAEDLGAGGGPGNAPALLLQGGVYRIADGQGNPTPDSAVVSMTGDIYNAPSAVLDALANQDGLLAEALGPIVAVTVRTQGASQASGKLIVTMTSPRAEMELSGEFTGGTFIAEGEPRITLHTVTSDLGRMLLSGMPLIGTFEKRAEDGPAQVKVTGLRVPLDGHLEKFNGDFTVELGTARFETSGVFGAILRATKQRETGMVGRRLQPLTLSIKDGVLTYARWKVPLGDFTFDTRGTVDLVNRRLDIVTYIPFGALTDEAAGAFNTGLGRLLTGAVPFIEQATMVPFRTRGGFADAKTEPDIELFLTETGRTLLRPDRLIREGLQNIFKPSEKK
ncbi:MAG: hypothetical protein KF678_03035 [Phycisphaeraceae bacterium]|nr:hypothetical protein [Phycisphaeraceae bacterium]